MKIQLYYFDDCSSYQKALDNLKEALRSQELPQEVEMIRVTSEADAQAKRFIGSPTIRINGIDIRGAGGRREGLRLWLSDLCRKRSERRVAFG